MEFEGRISNVMEPQSGTSQRTGNEWKSQEFVFEYFENDTDRYPDRVVLQTFDTNIMQSLRSGMECVIGFGHNTHEYNGRVFNELRIYKFEAKQQQQTAVLQPPAATASETVSIPPTEEKKDDLPF